jgi:uncharacterized membrane protein (UPF0127 family)
LNTTRHTVLGDRIDVAETSLSRMVGLLRKQALEPGTGLIIFPSQAVHTVGMRFPIDVVFIDRQWRVTGMHPEMAPFRLTRVHWKAKCVLELPIGMISRSETSVGDQLAIEY